MNKLKENCGDPADFAHSNVKLECTCIIGERLKKPIMLAICSISLILGCFYEYRGEGREASALTEGLDLLQITRANREVLSNGFPGFRSKLTVYADGRTHSGTMLFRPPITLEVELVDKDVRKKVKSTVRSLLSHRMQSDGSLDGDLRLAEADNHPLGRRILLGDKYDSSYRIRDRRILEVDRKMEDSRLVINVLETEITATGKYLPTQFFVTVFDRESGAVKSASAYSDVYQRIDGEYLPRSRRIIDAENMRVETLLIEWEAIELLAPLQSGD